MTDIKTFTNAVFSIQCIIVDDMPWFQGKEIATVLGYTNTTQAIRTNVDEEDKMKMQEARQLRDSCLDPNTKNKIYINEPGLYSLILGSKKPEAKEFKKWVMSEVLPSIRKSGSYHVHDFPQQQQIRIYSETDLHKKVVEFMRKHLPGHILVPGLGELQDTQPKRSNSYYKGYRGGQPDLMILNNHREHRGFAIELKTPKGTGQMTENQQNYLRTLEQNGFKTLVSNDYDEIIMELTKYFEGVRFRCSHCPKAFKTLGTQESHERGLHAKKRQRDDGFSS